MQRDVQRTPNILATLRYLQHRVWCISLLSYASVGALCAFLGVATAAMVFAVMPRVSMVLLGAICIIGGAAILAVLTRPSLPEIAAVIDRRLGLQQRLETAFEYLHHQDEIAVLLRRDANRHLQQVDPAQVFPVEIGKGLKAIACIALAVYGIVMLVHVVNTTNGRSRAELRLQQPGETRMLSPETHASGGNAPSHNNGTSERAPAIAQPQPDAFPGEAMAVSSVPSHQAQAPQKSPDTATGPQTVADVGQHAALPRRPAAQDNPPGTTAVPSGETVLTAQRPHSRTDAAGQTAEGSDTRHTTARQLQTRTSAAARPHVAAQRGEQNVRDRLGHMNPSVRSGSMPLANRMSADHAPTGARENSGPNTAASSATAAVQEGVPDTGQGGGAVDGHSSALSGVSTHETAVSSTYRQVYRQYRQAAEDVLSQEQIPPGFRHYIREYFVAIQP